MFVIDSPQLDEVLPLTLIAGFRLNLGLRPKSTDPCFAQFTALCSSNATAIECLGIPTAFILEYGAVGQLRAWEVDGFRPLLPANLPTFETALADLEFRAATDPHQFRFPESLTLFPQVFEVFLNFSRAAPRIMQANNILIGRVDEDKLVDAVANLLWSMRGKSDSSENTRNN